MHRTTFVQSLRLLHPSNARMHILGKQNEILAMINTIVKLRAALL